MKIIPFKDFIHANVYRYPTLYASTNFLYSKFAILDHFLNVIGNGIRNNDEMVSCIGKTNKKANHFVERIYREDFWWGYEKVEEINLGDKTLFLPSSHSGENATHCFEKDKNKYPNIKLWYKVDKIDRMIVPYPNFSKEYSLIYRCDKFLEFPDEWIKEAIFYYSFCKYWFLQDDCYEYSYAFPKKEASQTRRRIEEFILYNNSKSNEQISKSYGFEFDGDHHKFLSLRWQRERKRILQFIEESLNLLLHNLNKRRI